MRDLVLVPGRLTLAQLRAVARGAVRVALEPGALPVIARGAEAVREIVRRGEPAYGINTGFGRLATQHIPDDQIDLLQRNLVLSHAVGVGRPMPAPVVRLILATKISSLGRGHSGTRLAVIEALLALLNADVLPVIPEKGSVGLWRSRAARAPIRGPTRDRRGPWKERGARRNVLEDALLLDPRMNARVWGPRALVECAPNEGGDPTQARVAVGSAMALALRRSRGQSSMMRADTARFFSASIPLPHLTPQYRLSVVAVALAMVLLPVLHVGFVVLWGWAIFLYATTAFALVLEHARNWQIIALAATPILTGLITTVFLLKPFFGRRGTPPKPLSVEPAHAPGLFRLADELCDALGSPRPRRIDVDVRVNASAGLRRGVLSLLDPVPAHLDLLDRAQLTIDQTGVLHANLVGRLAQHALGQASGEPSA